MEMNRVSSVEFSAYLLCATKAYLIGRNQPAPDTFFANLDERILDAYRTSVLGNSEICLPGGHPIEFSELEHDHKLVPAPRAVDCTTAWYFRERRTPQLPQSKKGTVGNGYIPLLYSVSEKVHESTRLKAGFAAIAVTQAVGNQAKQQCVLIHGTRQRVHIIPTAPIVPRVQMLLTEMEQRIHSDSAPTLVLNKHCAICDFQSRCRRLAIESDNLSLLTGMTERERRKFEQKGFTTILQLSYGYRPRRHTREKLTSSRQRLSVKNDYRLKALAIKKGQVHVVGSPSLSIEGTPVFIDVEGDPDRNFYYLIGLRYQQPGGCVQKFFWANRSEDECHIWRAFLDTLKKIDGPMLVSYGAYESRFLKKLTERYKLTELESEFVKGLTSKAANLLATIYGRIYFPTYGNSLKDVAHWLGFRWASQHPSGAAVALLRRCWELTSDEQTKRELIAYNADDCHAAEVVANAIIGFCDRKQSFPANLGTVDVGSLEVEFQRTFGKFLAQVPEFEKINSAAYWDYQQSKVYVRTSKQVRQREARQARCSTKVVIDKVASVNDRPSYCQECSSPKIWIAERYSHVTFDLKFTRRGATRSTCEFRYHTYKCGNCGAHITPFKAKSKYGYSVRCYVIHLLIEMRLSHEKVSEHVSTIFKLPMNRSIVADIKRDMAKKYAETYQYILTHITSGPLINADETKGVVYGGGHYVWILANLTSVFYMYSATREVSVLQGILREFSGVLVSDFYAAYDSINCPQQKCLIHLMRDINEDLRKNPFNDELICVAEKFGILLRDIVNTIDRYGLKRFHLAKHQKQASRFIDEVAALRCISEPAAALKKRIDRNKEKLFTFLEYDQIPWNNNNAEHAVRAFTRLRNVIGTSTASGTADYCVLLSIQQTLRCRGISFLDFLLSGQTELGAPTGRRARRISLQNEEKTTRANRVVSGDESARSSRCRG